MKILKKLVLPTALVLWLGFSAVLIYMYMHDIPLEPETELRVDPIFNQTISGSSPQTVHYYEAGDDIRPNLYEVVYFPEIITNGSQGHYEVYRTMGKDRVN